MSALSTWIKLWPTAPRPELPPSKPEPATRRVEAPPTRVTALSDAFALIELLEEGAEPVLVGGTVYLQGRVTPTARELFNAHAPAIARLVGAFAAGKVNRQELAAKITSVEGWTWPGTEDAPAPWPGREAFLLGVEPTRCVDCRRYVDRECTRYGTLAAPQRAVRCLWALPRQQSTQQSGKR